MIGVGQRPPESRRCTVCGVWRALLPVLLLAACRSDAKDSSVATVALTNVDVPTLSRLDGTAAVLPLPLVTMSGSGADRSQVPGGAVLLAADRSLLASQVFSRFDTLAGVHELDIVVRVGPDFRTVAVERARALAGGDEVMTTMVLDFDSDHLEVDGAPAPSVPARRPQRVVARPASDVTLQRLAEVVADAGGHVLVGGAAVPPLPVVESR